MEARINTKITGVRGGHPVWSENKGCVTIFIDHSYQNSYPSLISVDAFQGYGKDYKRRETCKIQIQHEGKMLFHGSIEELTEILQPKNDSK
jgi:glyoxylate carboligase